MVCYTTCALQNTPLLKCNVRWMFFNCAWKLKENKLIKKEEVRTGCKTVANLHLILNTISYQAVGSPYCVIKQAHCYIDIFSDISIDYVGACYLDPELIYPVECTEFQFYVSNSN